MGLAGCVSDGSGKGDVGVCGGVIQTMRSLLEGASLEIHSCRACLAIPTNFIVRGPGP